MNGFIDENKGLRTTEEFVIESDLYSEDSEHYVFRGRFSSYDSNEVKRSPVIGVLEDSEELLEKNLIKYMGGKKDLTDQKNFNWSQADSKYHEDDFHLYAFFGDRNDINRDFQLDLEHRDELEEVAVDALNNREIWDEAEKLYTQYKESNDATRTIDF